jgi:signal transduction histidine kinase
VPTTLTEIVGLGGYTDADGTPLGALPDEEALRGRPSAALLAQGEGARRRIFSVRAVPLLDPTREVRGAVAVWRDVTESHAAITAVARLDAAVKTARRVTHEMGNALAPALGYGELLPSAPPTQTTKLAGEIVRSVDRAAGVLERLRRIERYAEVELGGDRMLDLDAAQHPAAGSAPRAG